MTWTRRLTEAQARKLGAVPATLERRDPIRSNTIKCDRPDECKEAGECLRFIVDRQPRCGGPDAEHDWCHWRITPVPAPRQHASDRWKRGKDLRAGVRNYRAFRDEVKLRGVWQPRSGDMLLFALPMPPSWPMVKRIKMRGAAHTSTPDLDNLIKALLDATYGDDREIWQLAAQKVWADHGSLTIFRGVLPAAPMLVPEASQ